MLVNERTFIPGNQRLTGDDDNDTCIRRGGSLCLQLHHNRPTPSLPRIPNHLRRIHHQTTLVTPRPRHEPLPKNTVDAMIHNLGHVDPRAVRHEVPDESPLGQ